MIRPWWLPLLWWLRIRGPAAAARAVFRCHEKLRIRILRQFGACIGPGTRIRDPLILMGRFADFSRLEIGSQTYVGPDCLFDLSAPVRIGDGAAVSARCAFVTHLDVGVGPLKEAQPPTAAAVEVEAGSWLGFGTTVLPGVRIGAASMVAAGAVVREDVPERCLAAGVPARVVRRLDEAPTQTGGVP